MAVCAAFAVFIAMTAPASAKVPHGFVGINLDGPGFPAAPGVNLDGELAQIHAAGVQRIRVIFSWAAAQPYASFADVPSGTATAFTDVGGVPTDFSQMDALVAAAARHQIAVQPIVLYAPSWDGTGASMSTIARPARSGPYANFLTALVHRYGRRGSFWRTQHAVQPITQWEIWNEPEISYFWPTQPFAASYVALLKAAHTAIKHADPHAQVVLGGLTGRSWQFLQDVYDVKGAARAFDIVASHPYTAKPAGVITILRYDRIVMDNNGGSHTPLLANELGWTSSQGHVRSKYFTWGTTEQGQARNDAAVLALLGRNRVKLGLAGFDLYTWASTDTPGSTSALGSPGFNYAGIEHDTGSRLVPKPAYAAFKRAALALER